MSIGKHLYHELNYICVYLFPFQLGRLWWADGRPVGFSQWNKYYFQNLAPQSIQYSQHSETWAEMTINKLVQDAQNVLQPKYTNFTMCTVLIGTPGPKEMEFLVVPCTQRINVSGILCIDGGKKRSPNELVYNLVHIKPAHNTSMSDGIHYFNIEEVAVNIWKEQLLSNVNFTDDSIQRETGANYYELLNDDIYNSMKADASKAIRWTWKESIYTDNKNQCQVFGSQQCTDGFLHKMSKQIMVLTDPS